MDDGYIWKYNYLEKLLDAISPSKSSFLTIRMNIENLLKLLLNLVDVFLAHPIYFPLCILFYLHLINKVSYIYVLKLSHQLII